MQLRRYWAVVRRRWRIVAAVVGLVAIVGGGLLAFGSRQYSAEVQFLLNREPLQRPGATADFRYEEFYRFQATEYALDDLVVKVGGNVFAQKVAARLESQGIAGVTDEEVMRSLKSEREHRTLKVEATSGDRTKALAMARAVEEVLTTDPEATAPPDGSRVNVQTIHRDPAAQWNRLRAGLTFGLQVALALLLGLGLAFLLEYLDDRVRDAEDARALGAPLLGRLPAAATRAR
jgi:capsular polysaccharide biosynthesis protein